MTASCKLNTTGALQLREIEHERFYDRALMMNPLTPKLHILNRKSISVRARKITSTLLGCTISVSSETEITLQDLENQSSGQQYLFLPVP